jgi:hypothetical protein
VSEIAATARTGTVALRVQFDVGERTFGVPVPFGRWQAGGEAHDRRVAGRADGGGMTVLDVEQSVGPENVLQKLRARWGRKK